MNRKTIKCLFAAILSLALVVSVCPQVPAQAKQKNATVSTQKELNAALKDKDIKKINIKTEDKLSLTVKGEAAGATITVTAPNATVSVNTGVDTVNIKSATKVNLGAKADVTKLNITTSDDLVLKVKVGAHAAGIVVKKSDTNKEKPASIKITNNGSIGDLRANDDNSRLSVINNTKIGKILLGAPTELTVSGKSDSATPVTIKKAAAGAVVSASTGIKLNAYAPADVNLQKGAGKSTVTVKSGNADLNVSNNTKKDISIKDQASGVSTKVESGATMSGEEIKNSVSSEIAKAEAEKKAAEEAEKKAAEEAEKKAAEEEAAKKAAEEASGNSGGGSSVTPVPTPAPSTYEKTEESPVGESAIRRTVTTYRVSDDKRVMEKVYKVSGEIVFPLTQTEWTYSDDAFIDYTINYDTNNPGIIQTETMKIYNAESDTTPKEEYFVSYNDDVVTEAGIKDYEDSHGIIVEYTNNDEKTATVYGTSLSEGATFESEQMYKYTGTVNPIRRPENLNKNTIADFIQSFYEAGNPVRTSGEKTEYIDSVSNKYYYTYHSDGKTVKSQIKETYTTENQEIPSTKTEAKMNERGLITSYQEYKNGNITKSMTVEYNDHNQISRIAEQDYSETIVNKRLKEVVKVYDRTYRRSDDKLSTVTAVTTTTTVTGDSLNVENTTTEKTSKEYSYFDKGYDTQERIHVVTEYEWTDPADDNTKHITKKLTVGEYYGTTETYKKATVEETSYSMTEDVTVTKTYEITYDEQGHVTEKKLINEVSKSISESGGRF